MAPRTNAKPNRKITGSVAAIDRRASNRSPKTEGKPRSSATASPEASPSRKPRSRGKWTIDWDNELIARTMINLYSNWSEIARLLNQAKGTTFSSDQCYERWKKVIDPAIVKGPWSVEEDAAITQSILSSEEYLNGETPKWEAIGRPIGRSGKQVRERWENQLNPQIHHGPWTTEEKRKLIQVLVEEKLHGSWVQASLRLFELTNVYRPANKVKNYANGGFKCHINKAWAAVPTDGLSTAEVPVASSSSSSAGRVSPGTLSSLNRPFIKRHRKYSAEDEDSTDDHDTTDASDTAEEQDPEDGLKFLQSEGWFNNLNLRLSIFTQEAKGKRSTWFLDEQPAPLCSPFCLDALHDSCSLCKFKFCG